MAEFDTYLRLLAAIVVPWFLGTVLATIVFGRQRSILTYITHGYLIGIAAELIVIRVFDALETPFSFWPMLSILLTLTIASAAYAKPLRTVFNTNEKIATKTFSDARAWRVILVSFLLLVLLIQIALVLSEATLRPTFPWDAWRGWEPKTLQFFENRSLTAPINTIGNYGSVSTQAQLWLMVALDEPRSNLSHLAWVFAYVAIGMCLYTHVAMHRTRLTALIAAATFLTTPYAATHAALSGYADLWLCLAFTLGIFTVVEYWRKPNVRQLLLIIAYSFICIQTKRAGFGMGIILIGVLAARHLGPYRRIVQVLGVVIVLAALTLLLTLLLGHPTEISIAGLTLSGNYLEIRGVGGYTVNFTPQTKPFIEAIFEFGSWHIVGVTTLFALGLLSITKERDFDRKPIGLALIASSAYLCFYFFVLAPASATDHTGLSRALLPLVPTVILFIVITLSARSEVSPKIATKPWLQ